MNEFLQEQAALYVSGAMTLQEREAWLEFEVKAQDQDARLLLHQTAFFAPKGLLGLAYWYLLYPIHSMIFGGMIQKLARRAADIARQAQA